MDRRLLIVTGLLGCLAAPILIPSFLQNTSSTSAPPAIGIENAIIDTRISAKDLLQYLGYFVINQILVSGTFHLEQFVYSFILTFVFQQLFPQNYVYQLSSSNTAKATGTVSTTTTFFAKYLLTQTIREDAVLNNIILFAVKIVSVRLLKLIVLNSLTRLEVEFFVIILINLTLVQNQYSHLLEITLLRNLLISFLAAICIIIVPYTKCSKIKRFFTSGSHLLNELIYVLFLVQFSTSFLILEYFHLNQFFIAWFLEYVFVKERFLILLYWLIFAILILFVLFIVVFVIAKSNDEDKSILNYKRKIWHFIIFIILTPILANTNHYEFIKIILSFIIMVFLIVELIRYLNINLVGYLINQIFKNFKDFRDEQGPIIISYLYLLIGISLPIFLNNSSVGLISLGIGDSFASIIGKKYGRVKWMDSDKTIAGTLSFISISFVIVAFLKKMFEFPEFVDKSYWCLFLACSFGGLFEALSDLNDNVLIPCIMTVAMEVFKNL